MPWLPPNPHTHTSRTHLTARPGCPPPLTHTHTQVVKVLAVHSKPNFELVGGFVVLFVE